MVIKDVLEKPVVVAGGGAPEMEMALYVKEEAKKRSGREQLAATAFADALEASIPLTLAENAGMDPLDVQVELRAAHSKGSIWYGVDAYNNKVNDMNKENVFEPVSVKEQVVRSATEAATMVLRIDEVIASKASKMPAGGPQGGAGGMGGMGGMGGEGGMPNMPE